jgi:hypothetical protein
LAEVVRGNLIGWSQGIEPVNMTLKGV